MCCVNEKYIEKQTENAWKKQWKICDKDREKCLKKQWIMHEKGGTEWCIFNWLFNWLSSGKLTEISHVLLMKNVWKKQQKMCEKNNEKCVTKTEKNDWKNNK
jgi:hypothetical protein